MLCLVSLPLSQSCSSSHPPPLLFVFSLLLRRALGSHRDSVTDDSQRGGGQTSRRCQANTPPVFRVITHNRWENGVLQQLIIFELLVWLPQSADASCISCKHERNAFGCITTEQLMKSYVRERRHKYNFWLLFRVERGCCAMSPEQPGETHVGNHSKSAFLFFSRYSKFPRHGEKIPFRKQLLHVWSPSSCVFSRSQTCRCIVHRVCVYFSCNKVNAPNYLKMPWWD